MKSNYKQKTFGFVVNIRYIYWCMPFLLPAYTIRSGLKVIDEDKQNAVWTHSIFEWVHQ